MNIDAKIITSTQTPWRSLQVSWQRNQVNTTLISERHLVPHYRLLRQVRMSQYMDPPMTKPMSKQKKNG